MRVSGVLFSAFVVITLTLTLTLCLAGETNQGVVKFGALTVRDRTSQTVNEQIRPGDELELQYNVLSGTPGVYTVDWLWSTNGQQYTVLTSNSTTNRYVFTVPDTTFSDTVYFRVRDHIAPSDYVTSEVQQVVPMLTVTRGPGIQTNSTVFRNRTVTMTIAVDATLPDLDAASDFAITFSASPDFANPVPGFVTAVNGSDISWITDVTFSPAYYKLSTTRLVADGYPNELSFVSLPVKVEPPPTCEGPGPEDLTLCSIFMQHPGGYIAPFAALQTVDLVASFAGNLSGNSITWAYSTDGVSYTNFAGVTGPTVEHTSDAVYVASLPDLVSKTFSLRATFTGGEKHSVDYDVGYLVSFPNLAQVYVNPPNPPLPHYIGTTVTTEPALNSGQVSNWQVTVAQPDGSNPQSFPVETYNISGNQVLVIWVLSDQQVPFVGQSSVSLKLGFSFQVNTDTVSVTEPQTTTFTKQNWVPHYDHMRNVASNAGSNQSIFPSVGAFPNLLGSSPATPQANWWRKLVSQDKYQICVYDGTQGPPWTYACFDNKWLNNNSIAGTLPYNQNPASFTLTKSGTDLLIKSDTTPEAMCGQVSSLGVYSYTFANTCDPATNGEQMKVNWF